MSTASIAKKAADKYLVGIEEDEMVCRFIEAASGLRRPDGVTAVAALKTCDHEAVMEARRGVRAIMQYWQERIAGLQRAN